MSIKPYSIQVSAEISAPAEKVFGIINDFNTFTSWSPFAKMDPTTVATVSKPGIGVGATYDYTAKRVGTGRMSIIEAVSPSVINMDMEFLAPNQEHADVSFTILETTDGCQVTWTMSGTRDLKARIMMALLQLDKMMSKHFADGLLLLKGIAEA
jgi:uncharacterized protein YndB with AHSA1/START domain